MKYTTGPWIMAYVNNRLVVKPANDSILIANVFYEDNNNADLLAAAPEMYEALIALLEITDPGIDGNKDAYVKAKIAIAKAEGR